MFFKCVGTGVDGFARSQSVNFTGDSLSHEILWRQGEKAYSLEALPEKLRDKPLRLRLWMRQAKVYALRTQR